MNGPTMTDHIISSERSARTMLGWLWRGYLRKHAALLAVAAIMMMLGGAMFGALSYMMKPMFDTVFIDGQTDKMWIVGTVLFSIFAIRAVTSVVQKTIIKRIAEQSAADLRTDLLRHLMQLDTAFHQHHSPGTLIERVQGDIQALGQVWTGIVLGVARDAIAVVSLFTVAVSIDWLWTTIAVIGIPLIILPSWAIQSYIRRKSRKAREVAALMSTRLDEVFHGINPIKLNSLEVYQADRYDALTERRVRVETEAAFGKALIPSFVDIMAGIGFVAVVIYGGSQIIEGDKTVGDFMAFFTAMAIAIEPLRRIGDLTGLWQQAAAVIDRLLDLFDTKPTLLSPDQAAPLPVAAPEIVFDDVHLNYDDHPVLRGTTFTAEAGKTTAFVGASGAGKSTVFNVLARLVDHQSGAVKLDGTETKAFALPDLRGLISTVSQDAALFDETIRENILLGRTDVSEDQLTQSLEDAHVSDFLDKMPNGIDSAAGPRGSNLSGGQRQRVAIARAILRDTPILLLDEATSALDTKSESIVQAALDRLAEGRTTLVIAHRLSTVQNAHKIIVMDQGKVVDQGTHDALLARGGHYADLYKLQFRDGAGAAPAPALAPTPPPPAAVPASKRNWLSRLFSGGHRD